MAGQRIQVYLDDNLNKGLELWQRKRTSQLENPAANNIMKEALLEYLIKREVIVLGDVSGFTTWKVAKPEAIGLEPEKQFHGSNRDVSAAERSDESRQERKAVNDERREGTGGQRVRRRAGTDSAGAASADGGGAGAARAEGEPGGRRGQRRRRPGARAARLARREADQ
jgi:hypothetical protein